MSWMIPRANIILIAFQSSKVWPTRSQLFTNFSSQSWCWLFRLFMASGNTYESTIPYRPLNILTTRQTHNPSHTVRNARRMWSQSEYPIGQNKQLRVLCCCSYCGMFAQHLVTKISIYIFICVCVYSAGRRASVFIFFGDSVPYIWQMHCQVTDQSLLRWIPGFAALKWTTIQRPPGG